MEAEERGDRVWEEKFKSSVLYRLSLIWQLDIHEEMLERQAKILVWTRVSPAVEKLDLQAVTIEVLAKFVVLVDKAASDKAWMRKGCESCEETCLCAHMDG